VNKRLILIHGRATKPCQEEKARLVRKCLLHGLDRADPKARKRIESGQVAYTFVYYGDLINQVMLEADPALRGTLTEKDPAHGGAPCEVAGSYDADLDTMLARGNDRFTGDDYARLLKEARDLRAADNLARLTSGLVSFLGLSAWMIRRVAPDLGAYLLKPRQGSRIRERLQGPLAKALQAGEKVCLVSHSMGCIVAYDVLWKLSRLSEYRELRGRAIERWVTLGCPLGEPGVTENLYDAGEGEEGRYPDGIVKRWINIAAHDDYIAHDGDMADDFRDMVRRGLVERIDDLPRIYAFWAGRDGSNPHKLYGYLDHPATARVIADWILEG
jgi:hypothetical protein